jgi:hypothetical protein
MLVNREPAVFRNFVLPALDFSVEELFDSPALQAHEMIVVPAFVQLEHRLAAFEMMADQKARLRKLREYAVYRSQTYIHIFGEQKLVNVFGGEMANFARFEQIENFEARQRGFEPNAFEVARGSHRLEFPDLQAIIVAAFASALQTRAAASRRKGHK